MIRSLIIAACFLCIGVNAQSRIGVELSVSANDDIKSEIESYVKRELRNLNDIDLYSSKPRYEIQVVAISPSDLVAISVVVIEIEDFTTELTANLNNRNLPSKSKDSLIKALGVRKRLVFHEIRSSGLRSLESLCKGIVTKIDTEVFELHRIWIEVDKILATPISSPSPTPAALKPRTTTKPLSADESPFKSEYVGGESTLIRVQNGTDRLLTLIFGGVKYTLAAGIEREIEVHGGRYEFSASVPRAYPIGGVKEFGKGYRYSWRFYLVRR
jgi:hypothetical protein